MTNTPIADTIYRLLEELGEDPTRPGLVDTPTRTARAWREWTSGYFADVEKLMTTFEIEEDGNIDEMIVVQGIPFYSHCEHHLAPIFGTVTIGYIPATCIVGLSKLNRLVDVYARRLQVQERITTQIADAIMKHLEPLGCGVLVSARHLCMESRGIKQQGHSTLTSALRGVFKDDQSTRQEFLRLIQ